jgi:hypothetical protein
MQGTIGSPTPQCKKCGSYMNLPKFRNGRDLHECNFCRRVTYDNPRWYERLMFWKY